MTLGNTSGPQFPPQQGQGEDASEGLSLSCAREAEVLGLEIPGPASFPWCLVRASGAPAPCVLASCLSPEDLVVSGFEASKIPPVQLGLAATSGYGKNAGNNISGLENSRCKGPEAGLKRSMSGDSKEDSVAD